MIFTICLGLLISLLSVSNYAMIIPSQGQDMSLVANDGAITIPYDLARQSEMLSSYLAFNRNTGNNSCLYRFQRGTGEDLIFQSAKKDVLENLFNGISNPDRICEIGNFDHLQKMFIVADYMQVPQRVRNLILCRLLNCCRGDEFSHFEPEIMGKVIELLKSAVRDGILDLKGTGFSHLGGLLNFFKKENYEREEEAPDSTVVTAIDLSHNSLQEIDLEKLFKLFPQLYQLDLNHNMLKNFSGRLPYGFRLDLSNNQLQKIQLPGLGQKQVYLNCANNCFSPEQIQQIEQTVHQGDKIYWIRKGIATLIPYFDPASRPMMLTGGLLRFYLLNHFFERPINNTGKSIFNMFFSKARNVADVLLKKIPEKKKIGNIEVPVRSSLNCACNIGSTVGIIYGARRIGRQSYFNIGFFSLGGKISLFSYGILYPLLQRWIINPVINRIINPAFAIVSQRLHTIYRRYGESYVAWLNQLINRDKNKLTISEQHPESNAL